MRRIARVLLPHGVDRRGIAVLSTGHVASDLFQGAITALLPFFVAERGYSYTQVGTLLLVASLGSALLQPLLGMIADRMRSGWMMPAGLAAAGAGFAAAGLAPSYLWTLAALLRGRRRRGGVPPRGDPLREQRLRRPQGNGDEPLRGRRQPRLHAGARADDAGRARVRAPRNAGRGARDPPRRALRAPRPALRRGVPSRRERATARGARAGTTGAASGSSRARRSRAGWSGSAYRRSCRRT